MKNWLSVLRWILLPLSIPVVLVGGGVFAYIYADIFKVWDEYVGATVLPVLGLSAAWLIAPKHKVKVSVVYYIIGVLVAANISPSYYPDAYLDKHPEMDLYARTYAPFYIAVVCGAICLVILVVRDRVNKSPLSSERATYRGMDSVE